jgi:hypothetical protein
MFLKFKELKNLLCTGTAQTWTQSRKTPNFCRQLPKLAASLPRIAGWGMLLRWLGGFSKLKIGSMHWSGTSKAGTQPILEGI